jgi:hypothetical protein
MRFMPTQETGSGGRFESLVSAGYPVCPHCDRNMTVRQLTPSPVASDADDVVYGCADCGTQETRTVKRVRPDRRLPDSSSQARVPRRANMKDGGSFRPLPQLDCFDCQKPMRVLTFFPMSNGMRDLSYKCEVCGKITCIVHKPEDR